VPNENSPGRASYSPLLGESKERICSAQYAALCAFNLELLSLYWGIGRLIGEREQGRLESEPWLRISPKIPAPAEFPGVCGFSATNLWRIKQFYEAYAKDEKLAPLMREIS
jgi:hypothetical protein